MTASFWRQVAFGLAAGLLLQSPVAGASEGRTAEEIAADGDLAFVLQLEPYRPRSEVAGEIVIWGHGSFKRDMMGRLLDGWISEFRRLQPNVTFQNRMYGTASAIGALYTGAGNLAILGEEISPAADRAFRRAKGYPPTGISIATGSLDVNYYDYAHMIFVHRENPLTGLSLPQLRAIFGAVQAPGTPAARTWGDLGLEGEWREAPIQPYGWKTDVDFALFFRERVLAGDHRWNTVIREFVHGTLADGSPHDHGQRILDALSGNRFGIAISNIRYQTPQVRALALAWEDGGPFVEATTATLISQAYPLTRIIPACIDRAPGTAIEPALREFLTFLLSRDGQSGLLRNSDYLPLGPAARSRELDKLQ